MFAVYEFEFFEDEGWVLALPFGLEGGTQGRDIAEAVPWRLTGSRAKWSTL